MDLPNRRVVYLGAENDHITRAAPRMTADGPIRDDRLESPGFLRRVTIFSAASTES